jgi:hypothetical protein
MYYLKNEQECFTRYKTRECSSSNRHLHDPSDEFIGEVIFKINVKLKFVWMNMILYHI